MKIKGIKSLCSLTKNLEITGLHVEAYYNPSKNEVFGRVLTSRILYIKGRGL